MADKYLSLKVKSGDKFGYSMGDVVDAIRRMAQDNARIKVEVSALADLTDSTTGTAAATTANVALPVAFDHVSGSDLAPKAGFDTAIGKSLDAAVATADSMNKVRALLGMPLLTWTARAIATAGTIPAQDKTLTGVDGSSATALEPVSGRARIVTCKNNFSTLLKAANEIAVAMGDTTLPDNSGGSPSASYAIADVASSDAGVANTVDSLSDTAVDAALTVLANNYASMLAWYNAVIGVFTLTDLTDSTSGTASTSATLAAAAIPAPYESAGSDAAPKAGFDTRIGVYANNIADLAARINSLLGRHNLSLIVDSSGGSADTTLAASGAALTAVDGTTGTSAVEQASAIDRLTKIRNNFSTLAMAVNELAPYYGFDTLLDSSGGTPDSATRTLVACGAATATGVGGVGAITLSDTVVDALLVVLNNNTATINAALAKITGAHQPKPLKVIAVP